MVKSRMHSLIITISQRKVVKLQMRFRWFKTWIRICIFTMTFGHSKMNFDEYVQREYSCFILFLYFWNCNPQFFGMDFFTFKCVREKKTLILGLPKTALQKHIYSTWFLQICIQICLYYEHISMQIYKDSNEKPMRIGGLQPEYACAKLTFLHSMTDF